MTYNAQVIGKSGARKRLVEEVVKQVEEWLYDDKPDRECMNYIYGSVLRYEKETKK